MLRSAYGFYVYIRSRVFGNGGYVVEDATWILSLRLRCPLATLPSHHLNPFLVAENNIIFILFYFH